MTDAIPPTRTLAPRLSISLDRDDAPPPTRVSTTTRPQLNTLNPPASRPLSRTHTLRTSSSSSAHPSATRPTKTADYLEREKERKAVALFAYIEREAAREKLIKRGFLEEKVKKQVEEIRERSEKLERDRVERVRGEEEARREFFKRRRTALERIRSAGVRVHSDGAAGKSTRCKSAKAETTQDGVDLMNEGVKKRPYTARELRGVLGQEGYQIMKGLFRRDKPKPEVVYSSKLRPLSIEKDRGALTLAAYKRAQSAPAQPRNSTMGRQSITTHPTTSTPRSKNNNPVIFAPPNASEPTATVSFEQPNTTEALEDDDDLSAPPRKIHKSTIYHLQALQYYQTRSSTPAPPPKRYVPLPPSEIQQANIQILKRRQCVSARTVNRMDSHMLDSRVLEGWKREWMLKKQQSSGDENEGGFKRRVRKDGKGVYCTIPTSPAVYTVFHTEDAFLEFSDKYQKPNTPEPSPAHHPDPNSKLSSTDLSNKTTNENPTVRLNTKKLLLTKALQNRQRTIQVSAQMTTTPQPGATSHVEQKLFLDPNPTFETLEKRLAGGAHTAPFGRELYIHRYFPLPPSDTPTPRPPSANPEATTEEQQEDGDKEVGIRYRQNSLLSEMHQHRRRASSVNSTSSISTVTTASNRGRSSFSANAAGTLNSRRRSSVQSAGKRRPSSAGSSVGLGEPLVSDDDDDEEAKEVLKDVEVEKDMQAVLGVLLNSRRAGLVKREMKRGGDDQHSSVRMGREGRMSLGREEEEEEGGQRGGEKNAASRGLRRRGSSPGFSTTPETLLPTQNIPTFSFPTPPSTFAPKARRRVSIATASPLLEPHNNLHPPISKAPRRRSFSGATVSENEEEVGEHELGLQIPVTPAVRKSVSFSSQSIAPPLPAPLSSVISSLPTMEAEELLESAGMTTVEMPESSSPSFGTSNIDMMADPLSTFTPIPSNTHPDAHPESPTPTHLETGSFSDPPQISQSPPPPPRVPSAKKSRRPWQPLDVSALHTYRSTTTLHPRVLLASKSKGKGDAVWGLDIEPSKSLRVLLRSEMEVGGKLNKLGGVRYWAVGGDESGVRAC
ncbi:hypothetical protein HDV05_000908 [Chytridiales sp. JEL 0842]|nr:hypothetical protein HDV05_000908 [Chytridiales sp. JEL 0842]